MIVKQILIPAFRRQKQAVFCEFHTGQDHVVKPPCLKLSNLGIGSWLYE